MFNIAKYWNAAKPLTKTMLWLISGIYLCVAVIMLGIVAYVQGIDFLMQRLQEIGIPLFQLYMLWPVAPLLAFVLFDGWLRASDKKETSND